MPFNDVLSSVGRKTFLVQSINGCICLVIVICLGRRGRLSANSSRHGRIFKLCLNCRTFEGRGWWEHWIPTSHIFGLKEKDSELSETTTSSLLNTSSVQTFCSFLAASNSGTSWYETMTVYWVCYGMLRENLLIFPCVLFGTYLFVNFHI